ncbi:MAG: tRNA pseudouridine(38-40) synthase TruA [Acidobacteria bacterium]|nr:tRNA pseudouridine(38-40) synthase TruA [Acidobacteriota bacterium]
MDEARNQQDSEKLERNLKLILAYDGSEFAGWQVQPGRPTIQGTLASAIGRLTGENVLPQGSGRTDAGVHAFAQVATFQSAASIPTENWVKALNDILPSSIRVLDVSDVPDDFHARKSARAKTYRYRIYRGAVCPPFISRYVWHYPFPLDEVLMAQAAELVVGEHDFTSFAAVDPERVERIANDQRQNLNHGDHRGTQGQTENRTTNIRTIFSSAWNREGDDLIYAVRGSGFLHHMVRNLVGTFLLVGKGTLTGEDLQAILAARSRSAAGPTAPASGLYLVEVDYGG